MVREIELDIEHAKSPEDILNILHQKKVTTTENITLRCAYRKHTTELQQFTLLVFINAALGVLRKDITKKNLAHFLSASLAKANSYNFSLSDFEYDIENHWKTHIEWKDISKVKEENALEGLFGLWKDNNISLEQIREKAWQRKS